MRAAKDSQAGGKKRIDEKLELGASSISSAVTSSKTEKPSAIPKIEESTERLKGRRDPGGRTNLGAS